MKVVDKIQGVPVNELKDGEIAVVIKWPSNDNIVGLVGQRYKNAFVLLGQTHGVCYPEICNSKNCKDFLVEVLKPGSKLEI